ncbi:GHMP family kinase ATP-binding protein [Neobacillus sp. LXY-1]|uniref:GHMP family kinase ATP-binding protein n=1 Tax=Neobacillus sp. LXY-1 TaxID=3379133 RepID=UPI003EE1D6AF
MRSGKGCCNGTFGELVQGQLGDRPFLITMPIQGLRSEALFIPDPTLSEILGENSKSKAKKAAKYLLQFYGLQWGGRLEICSNIPEGKGMASSSADIVATLKAIADSFSIPLSKETISKIAAKIEPTDGIMYEEVVAYDHIHGEWIESFGFLPPYTLVGLDLGGTINTIEHNQIKKTYSEQDKDRLIVAYDLIKEGFRQNNISYICKAATISASINQKILPKPIFNQLKMLAEQVQGGVVVAHSGTVAGIMMDHNIAKKKEVISCILTEFPTIQMLGPFHNTE